MKMHHNPYEFGLNLLTRFGKLLSMQDDFYRIRVLCEGQEVVPGKYWALLGAGQIPEVGARLKIEAHGFGGNSQMLCRVDEVKKSPYRFGLKEVIINWMRHSFPETLEELGEQGDLSP